MSLDFRFPLGRANAPICRWCKTPRTLRRRTDTATPYLICPGCDTPDRTITTTITTTEEST